MPLPINEHAIDEMHQGFNMVDDSMRNVNTTMESVLDSLNELIRINAQSLESLVDMLKIDTESLEMARLQRAFDEEKETEDNIVKPEITKEVKDNTDKNFAELMKNNAGLLTGVTAAVLGLMAMKDWIADGFKDAVKDIQNWFRTLPNADVRDVNSVEQMGREGLGLDTQATIAAEDVAMSQAPIGVTETQMYGMNPQGFLAAQKSREEIANQNAANDPIVMAQRVTEVHSKMREIYKEIQGDIDYAAGKDESNRDVAVAKRNAGIKISEIEKIAQKENVSIPPEIQSFIQSYKTESFQNLQLTTPDQVTPQQEPARSVPTPMNKMIESQSVTPPAGNYGISDSPSMQQFEKSQIPVNPSANEPLTIYIGGQSKESAGGAPMVIDNSTTNNNTVVQGGGNVGSSTGQYVGNATRTKSHQDAAASRNQ